MLSPAQTARGVAHRRALWVGEAPARPCLLLLPRCSWACTSLGACSGNPHPQSSRAAQRVPVPSRPENWGRHLLLSPTAGPAPRIPEEHPPSSRPPHLRKGPLQVRLVKHPEKRSADLQSGPESSQDGRGHRRVWGGRQLEGGRDLGSRLGVKSGRPRLALTSAPRRAPGIPQETRPSGPRAPGRCLLRLVVVVVCLCCGAGA